MAAPTLGVGARFFEDFRIGELFVSQGYTFTEAGVIDFAWQFDPQPFHTDVNYAREHSIYGGLIASGYHTMAVSFRLVHSIGLFAGTNITGRGLDEVRFKRPVYAGDTLHVRATVRALAPSKSRPDRGYVGLDWDVRNQRDECVLTAKPEHVVMRRPPSGDVPT
jgi:acyl dehydratase